MNFNHKRIDWLCNINIGMVMRTASYSSIHYKSTRFVPNITSSVIPTTANCVYHLVMDIFKSILRGFWSTSDGALIINRGLSYTEVMCGGTIFI